ncbi:MAG: mechanosensitive ion channel, partial [Gammaproteobacteria bacterium]|nr:mechanosensitive ion channel [Gammaproteobacteria bacterium]
LLNDLKGIETSTTPAQPRVPTAAGSAKADLSTAATPLPLQMFAPDAVTTQVTEEFDVRKGVVLQLAETAEQLEARKEAEKKVEEATRAAQVVVDYVGLKEDLREQITLEEKQLGTTVQSRTNHDQILQNLEKELQERISAGASKSELQKIRRNIARSRKEIAGTDKQIEQQKGNLEQLRERLKELREERLTVVEEAQEKREEAETATKKSIWLQSPLHPVNLLEWVYTRAPRVVMVVAGMLLLLLIIRISISRLMKVMVRTSTRVDEFSQDRAETLALGFRGVAKAFILFGGLLLILQEAGFDITTVLGGAAILGVAVAFGAQGLMRDYLTGFMILLEDQYKLNDVVTIGNVTGKVEKVSMRTTVLRDQEGHVHFIPNGEIKGVTNNTYEWSQAVFEIGIAHKESVDHTMEIIVELANELREDPIYGGYITDKPDMLGVDRFAETGVVIKFRLKTKPNKMWPVKREMLRRIKNRFDELGIEIPAPLQDIFKQKNST